MTELAALVGVAAMAGTLLLISVTRKWIVDKAKHVWDLRPWGYKLLTGKRIKEYISIQTKIAELRVVMNAGRVFVSQFSNGEYFSPMSPSWKASVTHEVCASHIKFFGGGLQDLKISLVIDTFGPMILGNELSGVTKFICPNPCPRSLVKNRHIYFSKITTLPPTYFKQIKESQGCKYNVIIPLMCRTGNAFGLLGIDYFEYSDMTETTITANICKACEAVDILEFFLATRKNH